MYNSGMCGATAMNTKKLQGRLVGKDKHTEYKRRWDFNLPVVSAIKTKAEDVAECHRNTQESDSQLSDHSISLRIKEYITYQGT